MEAVRNSSKRQSILLYDATCRFCTASSKRALWFAPRGSLLLRDVNDPALQARYGVTPDAAKRAMHLVSPRGRVSVGAYAMRELLRRSRWVFVRPLAYLWRVPGFAWVADHAYSWVADHRYLFMGRSVSREDGCEDDACSIHLGKKPLSVGKGG